MIPFALLLLSIAVIPFISKKWWEKYYPLVSLPLGAVTALYCLFISHNPGRLGETFYQFFSFITLIGSLYVVSGGIHLEARGSATPFRNVIFLGAGALLSNLFGTMGASMVLIRPFLRLNNVRYRNFHIIFFIFLVCNIGGALLPVGDPPLFLGYLLGVPFFWICQNVWPIWLVSVILLLILFYIVDRLSFRKFQKRGTADSIKYPVERITVTGKYNILFLAIILGAVFINRPPLLREAIMVASAIISRRVTHKEIYKRNEFNFFPLKEIAVLFLGIFITLVPVLEWLEGNAITFPLSTIGGYYWGSGILSSILDNAPTYLNFLTASMGLNIDHDSLKTLFDLVSTQGAGLGAISGAHAEQIKSAYEFLAGNYGNLLATGNVSGEKIRTGYLIANHPAVIRAISVGSVFFGAFTYIGNAPNYVVKSIAENSGIPTPPFHTYILRYSIPVLLPLFVLIWLIWF